MKKRSWMGMALAAVVGLSACYGPFNLTRRVWDWNGNVGENKWVNEVVFLALNIVPVYGIATLADAVIFNSIEFWTGENPVLAREIESIKDGDAEAVLSYKPDDRRLRVDNFEKGRHVSTMVFEPSADGTMVATNGDGELLMRAETRDGLVVLTNPAGTEVGRFAPGETLRLSTLAAG